MSISIEHIEAAGDYMCIRTADNSLILRETMKDLERRLDPRVFQRVHRSTIVNLNQVRQVKPHTNGECFLVLDSGAQVKVSRATATWWRASCIELVPARLVKRSAAAHGAFGMTGHVMHFILPGFDLDAFVAATLAEDLGVGLPGGGHDVTSESVIPADARFAGVMDSRDAIVVAGLPIAAAFFRKLDPAMEIEVLAAEGAAVPAGADLMRLAGNARAMLTAERSALNTVQHLSGIATMTRQYVDAMGRARPCCSIPARPSRACATWRNTPPAWAARRTTAWACGTRR